jgi:hypothetical protein
LRDWFLVAKNAKAFVSARNLARPAQGPADSERPQRIRVEGFFNEDSTRLQRFFDLRGDL